MVTCSEDDARQGAWPQASTSAAQRAEVRDSWQALCPGSPSRPTSPNIPKISLFGTAAPGNLGKPAPARESPFPHRCCQGTSPLLSALGVRAEPPRVPGQQSRGGRAGLRQLSCSAAPVLLSKVGPLPRPGPWGAESPPRSAGRPALPAPSPATVTAACCPEPIARPLRRPSLLTAPPEAGALILCLFLGRRLGSGGKPRCARPGGLSFRTRRGCGLITWPPPASPALGPGFGRRKKRGRPQPPTQARSSRNVCPRRLSEKTNFLSTLRSPSADQGTGECLSVSSLKSGPEQYNAPVITSGQQPQRRCPQTRRRPGERAHASPPPGPEQKPRQQPLRAASRQDAVSSGWGASDECALLGGVRVRQRCSCARVQ